MAYDLYAGGATTGPNAPLNPPTDSTVGTPDSFITAINAWTGSGMPQSKIVMGLPLYGYAVTPKVDMSSGINMIVAADVANVPHGDQNDEMATEPCVKGDVFVVVDVLHRWHPSFLFSQALLKLGRVSGRGATYATPLRCS
ncbi:hypothetical protein BC936DRAFT_142222 [Jimgerdemannia flammicorona]|uniref:GH18 domain-containing protein n=1 Tax=Jimgerdemannia flammicorona TaxID=994334 RepID=A0A433A0P2_9FUNG|nr:hypothetical protein BC936DRAFT_142222 [Jimgerdemannia flammicorona]